MSGKGFFGEISARLGVETANGEAVEGELQFAVK